MRCVHCNNIYSDNGTKFCSVGHRRQYERKAKLCARPDKRVYDTVEQAMEYIDSRPDDKLFKKNLLPYTDCTCKRVHIGHRTVKLAC